MISHSIHHVFVLHSLGEYTRNWGRARDRLFLSNDGGCSRHRSLRGSREARPAAPSPQGGLLPRVRWGCLLCSIPAALSERFRVFARGSRRHPRPAPNRPPARHATVWGHCRPRIPSHRPLGGHCCVHSPTWCRRAHDFSATHRRTRPPRRGSLSAHHFCARRGRARDLGADVVHRELRAHAHARQRRVRGHGSLRRAAPRLSRTARRRRSVRADHARWGRPGMVAAVRARARLSLQRRRRWRGRWQAPKARLGGSGSGSSPSARFRAPPRGGRGARRPRRSRCSQQR